MRRVLVGLTAVLVAGPVSACINDVELPTHEREFRSQYARSAPPPAPPAAESAAPAGPPVAGLTAGGVGVVLLAAAAVAAFRGPAPRG